MAKALFVDNGVDAIVEHGEWCKARCLHKENRDRIDGIIAEHLAKKKGK